MQTRSPGVTNISATVANDTENTVGPKGLQEAPLDCNTGVSKESSSPGIYNHKIILILYINHDACVPQLSYIDRVSVQIVRVS
jgi:hypothetical protein